MGCDDVAVLMMAVVNIMAMTVNVTMTRSWLTRTDS